MRYGVFKWHSDSRYKREEVVKWYLSGKAAQKFADKENEKDATKNLVVRPENYVH